MRIFLLVLVLATLLVFIRLVALRLRPAARPHTPVVLPPLQFRKSGPLEVKHYWFGAFDHREGPPDPENFYEEFTMEVGEQDSSVTRSICLYVATPRALVGLVPMNSTEYAFARNLIVVPRFDMALILRAVKEQLSEICNS